MIIIVSDLHIGDRNFKYFDFLDFLMSLERGTTIILNGDFEDLYKISQPKAMEEYSLVYSFLKKFNVKRVKGNHDEILTLPKKLEFETNSGLRVAVCHGHHHDFLVKNFSWYTRVASKVEKVLDSIFMCNFRRVLRYLSLGILTYLSNKINYKALEHHDGYDLVVIGHTHFPKVISKDGRYVVNCGEWLHDCTYVKITDDGNVSLHWWIKNKKKEVIKNG